MVYFVPILIVAISAFLIYLAGAMRKCIYPSVQGQPPNWVFSVVWPILYVLLAWAGERIWRCKNITSRVVFVLLLSMLVLWPFVQWYWCSSSFSLIIILFSLVLSIGLLAIMVPQDYVSSILLLPLVLWLSYASLLNWRVSKQDISRV